MRNWAKDGRGMRMLTIPLTPIQPRIATVCPSLRTPRSYATARLDFRETSSLVEATAQLPSDLQRPSAPIVPPYSRAPDFLE